MSSPRRRWACALWMLLAAGRGAAEPASAGGLPWVAFARVSDAPAGAEAKLAQAIASALLRSEANVVDPAELAKAAGRRGVARARWGEVGALNQVAEDVGAEHLLFGVVRGAELELFTLGRAGEIGASERVPLGRRGAPPSAAELEQALARLLARLPRSSGASSVSVAAPPPPPPPPPPDLVIPPLKPPPGSSSTSVAAATPSPPPAAAPQGGGAGVSGMKLGLFTGAGVLALASAGAVAWGVVTGMDAMAQSNAILTLPKESPVRQERERASLDAAVMADLGYGSAALLLGAAAGVAVWGALAE